jgi:hypothetical protein
VQIIASLAAGGRSLSQHSQLGLSSSMAASPGPDLTRHVAPDMRWRK